MDGRVRNLYPGGNTPDGFYSYYNYILPQREAEKIFCIKGGPGTGKSTLMKNIAQHFIKKGEDVDLMWCSSDPSSLDGVLTRNRNIAVVDGTAPHVVDPKNPGAVDEIVNLGDHWDEDELKKYRGEIVECSSHISEFFGYAYGYLKCAQQQQIFMGNMLDRLIPHDRIRELKNRLKLNLDAVTVLKRAEGKAKRDDALGRYDYCGRVKRFFAGAITPAGIKSNITSVANGAGRVIILDVPVGFRTDRLLRPVAERLADAGLDVEDYYCPMFPEERLEHIVCPGADIAIVTSNDFHTVGADDFDGRVSVIKAAPDKDAWHDEMPEDIFRDLRESSRALMIKAVEMLRKAKEQHDVLEGYYISGMDFSGTDALCEKLTDKIENAASGKGSKNTN